MRRGTAAAASAAVRPETAAAGGAAGRPRPAAGSGERAVTAARVAGTVESGAMKQTVETGDER
ncbi:hypothetical protein GCM10010519_64980 [Streptomyces lactacystinicus]